MDINFCIVFVLFFQMQIVIVDGAHENGVTGANFNGVLQGLAPMCPPPNAIIAFPCHPGTIRKEQRRLYVSHCTYIPKVKALSETCSI